MKKKKSIILPEWIDEKFIDHPYFKEEIRELCYMKINFGAVLKIKGYGASELVTEHYFHEKQIERTFNSIKHGYPNRGDQKYELLNELNPTDFTATEFLYIKCVIYPRLSLEEIARFHGIDRSKLTKELYKFIEDYWID